MENVILLIVIAALAGGSVAPFAKVALEAFQPFTLIGIRFLSASLVLLPFVIKNKALNARLLKQLLLVAVVGSLNPILLFLGLQFTPSSISPLIYAAVPLMTAIYLRQARGREISADKILGILVGFAGVAIIILLPLFQKGSVDIQSLWGNLLILGAAVAFMFYGIISKDKQQQSQVSPLALTFYLSVVTLVLSLPFSWYEISHQPAQLAAIQPRHLFSGLEIGILGTSLFYISYQKAIRLGNELTASLFTYLQPIATIVFAVLLLGEKITLPFIAGGTLALIGAGMASAKGKVQAVEAIFSAQSSRIYYRFFFALFWAYLFFVASLTLFPIPTSTSPAAPLPRQSTAYILSRVNVIPFDYHQFKNLNPMFIVIRQIVDNILLTMPFGFLINFVARSKIRNIPLLALAVGISIETAQLAMCLMIGRNYRGIDINDALMNMVGVLAGYGCFCIFSRWFIRLTERLQAVPTGLLGYVYIIAKLLYPAQQG